MSALFVFDANGTPCLMGADGHPVHAIATEPVPPFTPVQVVGPGQVAVDAADLRTAMSMIRFDDVDDDVRRIWGNFRVALAAAETDGETYTQAEVADLTSQAYRDGQRLAEDRAAARGRNEALDDLYAALDVTCEQSGPHASADGLMQLLRERLAFIIEDNREQGGDL